MIQYIMYVRYTKLSTGLKYALVTFTTTIIKTNSLDITIYGNKSTI